MVSIKQIGEYNKAMGFLRVDGGGVITNGHSQYYVRPDHFEVTTDGKGKWFAKFIE